MNIESVNKWTNGFGIAFIVMDAEAVCGECADAPKWTYKGKAVPDDMWPEIGTKLAHAKHIYLNTLQSIFGSAHDVAVGGGAANQLSQTSLRCPHLCDQWEKKSSLADAQSVRAEGRGAGRLSRHGCAFVSVSRACGRSSSSATSPATLASGSRVAHSRVASGPVSQTVGVPPP